MKMQFENVVRFFGRQWGIVLLAGFVGSGICLYVFGGPYFASLDAGFSQVVSGLEIITGLVAAMLAASRIRRLMVLAAIFGGIGIGAIAIGLVCLSLGLNGAALGLSQAFADFEAGFTTMSLAIGNLLGLCLPLLVSGLIVSLSKPSKPATE